ncbi:Proteasome lid subunit RPN8/RPN11, contains Jab1/MPN metalloenzyme (JAMM) motif [Paenibacillus sp. UNCCL117]|uniref:M67 family metallopeptidase n=1 Tax=unclassified Paenibacillus TaxID=185978 RepID=UPI00088E7335|nr:MULTISPECIES: M67 family metallopeptidase [unclassified Paenibacillus]SDC22625.1 Proteasome lid subunit RPN8/RPN11, contains Jab1/MPN metalloenzyme (JAMM) motif [Paenibacillus sp. cl123]SFW19086.1 Proteasome lid subunit RPN8/RPN11, contains Jab1/MPN metalloenzyme (JAMM) motif [Paenibacillus sp. UNCCL117]
MTTFACISIRQSVLRQLQHYCCDKLPLESCGLLFGAQAVAGEAAGTPLITRFVPIDNIAEDPKRRFVMQPQQLISALYNQTRGGDDGDALLGIAHAHPAGAAVPSREDLASLWHTLPSHWILSAAGHQEGSPPQLRAYRYSREGGDVIAQPLVIRIVPGT